MDWPAWGWISFGFGPGVWLWVGLVLRWVGFGIGCFSASCLFAWFALDLVGFELVWFGAGTRLGCGIGLWAGLELGRIAWLLTSLAGNRIGTGPSWHWARLALGWFGTWPGWLAWHSPK